MAVAAEHLNVRVESRNELDMLLGRAVDALLPRALAYGDRGIRVTRRSANDFTVAIDRTVPFGSTYEDQTQW